MPMFRTLYRMYYYYNIEHHSKSNFILTAFDTSFEQYLKQGDRIRRGIETTSHFAACQNFPNSLQLHD